ncbi:hypothetical protein PIB30_021684 [Stylosanthes scabra]|uniref:Uncharacterized protein n=1 Tax=Stylosanthes scabra TaxID=79078 RepID=A0ABU6Q8S9_9FABA|nr:hypothetical protein [Stylosanthes scabra]
MPLLLPLPSSLGMAISPGGRVSAGNYPPGDEYGEHFFPAGGGDGPFTLPRQISHTVPHRLLHPLKKAIADEPPAALVFPESPPPISFLIFPFPSHRLDFYHRCTLPSGLQLVCVLASASSPLADLPLLQFAVVARRRIW